MRSFRAQNNALAVSANTAETAVNVAQDPDMSLQVAVSDTIGLERRREDNVDELTGREEASTVYDLGQTAQGNLTFNKAQPNHFGFVMAYGLGSITTEAAGGGYKHTITPIAEDLDLTRSNPTFSLAMKYGETVLKRLFSSMAVDQITATFARDEWVKLTASLKGTGKVNDNVISETVEALDNVTALTLANAVEGSTAEERLDSIHEVLVELTTGVWTQVVVTAADDADPCELTIEDPGGAGDTVNYKVLYRPAESDAWMTFPALIEETPMRTSDVTVNVGGQWSGSAFTGGRTMACDAKSIEWSFQNNLQVEFCFSAAGDYAGRIFRDGRTQTVKVDREFRDMVYQQGMTDNDEFALKVMAEGAEFDTGHNFTVDLVFPRVAFKAAPISVDGKRLAESIELAVLEHETYGSVIAIVKNEVATYAA